MIVNCKWKTLQVSLMLHQNSSFQASLVAQWIRICLPMQRAQIQSLVQEDSTCLGTTKLVSLNYWSPCALEPSGHNYCACVLQPVKPEHPEPVLCNKTSLKREGYAPLANTKVCTQQLRPSAHHLLLLEKACAHQQRPSATGKKKQCLSSARKSSVMQSIHLLTSHTLFPLLIVRKHNRI